MRSKLLTTVFLFFLNTGLAAGAEYHGIISVEDYYSDDTSSAYDLNLLTTRLRLDATKLNAAGTLSFHFDGRERNNLGSRDYNRGIRNERIDTLNFEYTAPSKRFHLSAGRLWPKELPVERVDGVNMVYQGDAKGMGIFGGLKPDPYTDELNSDFSSAGAYVFYRKEDLSASLAFVHNGYKGGTDRQYFYSQASYSPIKEVRAYGQITADINTDSSSTDLTTAMAELSYRPGYSSGISIGYNQFQAIKFYRSMDFDIYNTRQQSYYIRGDYRFLNRYYLYGRYERRDRYYPSIITKLRYSDSYQMGFRNDNLMNSGTTININATITDSYTSTYNTYYMELSRLFLEIFQLVINGSYSQNKYEIVDYTDSIATYGAAGYLILGKWWNLSLSYEGREAKEYKTNSVMSRITYRY